MHASICSKAMRPFVQKPVFRGVHKSKNLRVLVFVPGLNVNVQLYLKNPRREVRRCTVKQCFCFCGFDCSFVFDDEALEIKKAIRASSGISVQQLLHADV